MSEILKVRKLLSFVCHAQGGNGAILYSHYCLKTQQFSTKMSPFNVLYLFCTKNCTTMASDWKNDG